MNLFSPKETTQLFCDAGWHKTKQKLSSFMLSSIQGGAFIALGGLLTIIVVGGMPHIAADNIGLARLMAGALFPIGLIMVVLTGTDLFTSNCAGLTMPLLQQRITATTFIKFLLLSYLFNLIGAQIVAYFFSASIGLFDNLPWQTYLFDMAGAKLQQDFFTVFVKGIGANWLVCTGAWLGYAAKDVIGKSIGIWIPVMLFVVLGYEHSIANLFFIPAAIYAGADLLWSDFLINNLLPATLGNLVGGALFVGWYYWFLHLREK